MKDTILIVEQDPRVAAMYRGVVEDLGEKATIARDGIEALAFLRRQGPPRAMITALSLAGADGFVVLRELRRLAPQAEAPAVVNSAFADMRARALAMKDELGISAVLAKGAPASTVLRTLQATLAGKVEETPAPPPTAVAKKLDEARVAFDKRRIEAIDKLGLASGDEDEALQQLVADVAKGFNVPMALVTLVLEDRQFFKAHTGLTGKLLKDRGTPRSWAFCAHAVEAEAPLVVPDAAIHPSFKDNPLVRDGTMRSYAGVPLGPPSGPSIGTLCILDTKPMAFRAEQIDALSALARRVAGELELRAQARAAAKPVVPAGLPDLPTTILDHLDHAVMVMDLERKIVWANRTCGELFDVPETGLVGLTRDDFLRRQAPRTSDPESFLRVMAIAADGPWAGRLDFELQTPVPRTLRWVARPVRTDGGVFQLAVYSDVSAG